MLFVAGCPIIDDLNERQGAMYFNQRAPNIFFPKRFTKSGKFTARSPESL